MRVELNGTEVVVLADRKSRFGYRVVDDADNFFDPSSGFEVFMGNPQVGVRPWVVYVRSNGDFAGATCMPLDKSRITRVSR